MTASTSAARRFGLRLACSAALLALTATVAPAARAAPAKTFTVSTKQLKVSFAVNGVVENDDIKVADIEPVSFALENGSVGFSLTFTSSNPATCGANPEGFSTLGEYCFLAVLFGPTSVGRVRDTLVVTDTVTGQVKRVSLVGTGPQGAAFGGSRCRAHGSTAAASSTRRSARPG